MNLNLGKFKKMKEDAHSATLKHPAGHEIRIAKSVLSKKMREDLGSLHMAEGGEVTSADQLTDDLLEQEAKKLNENKNLAPNRIDEASRSMDPNFQQQFPQATKPQQPIVINVGQPQQAPAPQPVAPGGIPNYDPNAPWTASGLSPLEQIKLKSPDATPQEVVQINKDQAERQMADAQRMQAYQAQANPQAAPAPQMQAANMQQAPAAPQAPSDPYGTQAYLEEYQKGLGEQKTGIAEEQKATSQLGQNEAGLLKSGIEQQQAQMKSYQDHYNELDQERKNFVSDIQNQHVDPRNYMANQSTGQKIATSIGLILGGMGGGLTGQGNPVLDYLNKEIDRDISAQQSNINKSQNLLTANMNQFHNMKDAVDMTRVMFADVVSNQLKQAAATAQTPMAKANALKAAGQIDMAAAPVLSQIAMRKSITSSMQSGRIDPSQVIRMIVPQGQQDTAYKELAEAKKMIKMRDNILGAFDEVAKINTIANRLGSPIQSKKQINAILNPIIAGLSKETAGRFTEQDSDYLRALFETLGGDEQTMKIQKSELNKRVSEKMNFPILDAYGINMNAAGGDSRYGASGEKKIQLGAPVLKK